MKHFSKLTDRQKNYFRESYFLPEDESNIFINENKKPYEQTPDGRYMCPARPHIVSRFNGTFHNSFFRINH